MTARARKPRRRSQATGVARRSSTCPWGPVIGTLRHIDLKRPSSSRTQRIGAPARIRTNAAGSRLLIEADASAAAELPLPVRIEYIHVMGGTYVHVFSSRARARVTPRGLVLTGISVKPFIEG